MNAPDCQFTSKYLILERNDLSWIFLNQVSGGADEDRTHDLRIANATLSQLSYRPKIKHVARRLSLATVQVYLKNHDFRNVKAEFLPPHVRTDRLSEAIEMGNIHFDWRP